MTALINRVAQGTGRLPPLAGRAIAWIVLFGIVGLGFAALRPSLAVTFCVSAAVSALTVCLLVAAMAQEPGSPAQQTLRRSLSLASTLLLGSMLWLTTFAGSALAGDAGLAVTMLVSLVLFALAVTVEAALAAVAAVLVARNAYQMPAVVVAVLVAERFCGLFGETR